MRFLKIKWNGKKAVLVWVTMNGDAEEKHELECTDEPLEGFTDALDALRPVVARLIGAHRNYAEGVTVTQVSMDKDQNDRRGFVFTARKDVARAPGPFHFNTPRVPEGDPDAGHLQERCLGEDDVAIVERLILEAKGYVEGKRAQGELALNSGGGEGGGEEEEPENPEEDAEGGAAAEEEPDGTGGGVEPEPDGTGGLSPEPVDARPMSVVH